jgi:hypothetical protein
MSIFLIDPYVICEPLCRVPRDINLDSSAKSSPVDDESPKVDKPPRPQVEKTVLEPRSPQARRMHEALLVLVVLHLLQPVPPRATTPAATS